MRMFEEGALRSDDEDKFITSVWLDFAERADQVDSVGPTQVSGQLSGEKTCVQKIKIMTNMCTHPFSMTPSKWQNCIALLTYVRCPRQCSGA